MKIFITTGYDCDVLVRVESNKKYYYKQIEKIGSECRYTLLCVSTNNLLKDIDSWRLI